MPTKLSKLDYLLQGKRTVVMGILNITPDSFSDGGWYYRNVQRAVARAKKMLAEGADIIDVGGESTRPGATAVSVDEELRRVVPVIKKIRKQLGKGVIISIDTNKPVVAERALLTGASLVNSLGGFTFDPGLAAVIAKYRCPVIIYHIKGEPRTMQAGAIIYRSVVADICEFFKGQMSAGLRAGIKNNQFILDPGIGFGKTVKQNLLIIKQFSAFAKLGCPTLIGVSRKSHLGKVLQAELGLKEIPEPSKRVEAGLAEVAVAVLGGAKIVRTHDVAQTKKFLTVLDKLK